MKSQNEIENILKEIRKDPIKEKAENKKRWYKVKKYLLQKNKLTIHNKSKVAARKTYQNSKNIRKDPHHESFSK